MGARISGDFDDVTNVLQDLADGFDFSFVEDTYKSRIWDSQLGEDLNALETDLYTTGKLESTTRIVGNEIVTLEYAMDLEAIHGDIFGFSDWEIEEIENYIGDLWNA